MKSFLSRWFSEEKPQRVDAFLPERQTVYCVGDIHGRLDLLQQLQQSILNDAAESGSHRTLIYLGDYIDRGDQSKEVIDHLLESPLAGFETIHLLGNHEQTMLDFLQHPKAAAGWLTFGGLACLRSYGIKVNIDYKSNNISNIRDELQVKLPQSHLDFLQSCKFIHFEGSYCFVHAGLRPGVPIGEQRNEDLLWIRDDFTRSQVIHDHIVVHGHTINQEVEFLPNRIGIDTGAYQTGVLTCLVLEGKQQRLLQTGVGASFAREG